jgi:hypothetical protein
MERLDLAGVGSGERDRAALPSLVVIDGHEERLAGEQSLARPDEGVQA